MAAQNFPPVMAQIFKREGGYVDHPRDPGGATNMGITHKTLAAARGVERVSKAEVKALTKAEAESIYRANYWNKVKGDDLPPGFDLVAMDGAVNSGVSRGAKWLQRGLGVTADGKVGPNTVAVAKRSGVAAIRAACEARMGFLRGLGTWGTFGKGWARRVAGVEAEAVMMFTQASGGPVKETMQAGQERAVSNARATASQAKAQTGVTGTAGGTIGVALPDLTSGEVLALVTVVAVAFVLILLNARHKINYNRERAIAYATDPHDVLPIGPLRAWACTYMRDGAWHCITLYGTDEKTVRKNNRHVLPRLKVEGELLATIDLDEGEEQWIIAKQKGE